jgi:hypothetical protein
MSLIGSTYNWTEFYVYSSYVNRTLASADYFMYGFYPPGTGPNLSSEINKSFTHPPYNGSYDLSDPDDTDTAALPKNF